MKTMECGVYPGLASWERFSRPYGTGLAPNLYPALRAGLSSVVPAGLIPIRFRGWFVFGGSGHISRSKRANWTRLKFSRPLRQAQGWICETQLANGVLKRSELRRSDRRSRIRRGVDFGPPVLKSVPQRLKPSSKHALTARLNPCPSFGSLLASLAGSVKASCAFKAN
jgi:hypothetical protein